MTLLLHCRLVLSGEPPFLTLCDFVVWLPFGIHSWVADVLDGMVFSRIVHWVSAITPVGCDAEPEHGGWTVSVGFNPLFSDHML